MGIPISKSLPEIYTYMYMYNLIMIMITPSQLDDSGEISIDKLTAYKTDLEYLDDHFQVCMYTLVIIISHTPAMPLQSNLISYTLKFGCCI